MGKPRKKKTISLSPKEEEDRLSNLPDAIIHHILCLLHDTKSSVQTSVISKRWRRLWASIPDLSFNTKSFSHSSSFKAFVLTALQERDGNSEVGRLHLSIPEDLNHRDVDVFLDCVIKYAACHCVRHLIIHDGVDVFLGNPLPRALLGCQNLKTLELRSIYIPGLSSALTSISTLHLEGCQFEDGFDIFAAFPNVTDLTLIRIFVHGYDDIFGEDSVLKISGPKLASLRLENQNCKVKLSAPNLVIFKYSHWLCSWGFCLIDLPSLQHAEVCFPKKIVCSRVFELFQGIRNAEFLKLNSKSLEVIDEDGLLENQTASFSKLKHLRLLVKSNSSLVTVPTRVISYLLSGTPHPDNVHIELQAC